MVLQASERGEKLSQPMQGQRQHVLRSLMASMRPQQWVKNLFVLAPLLFGKQLGDLWAIGQAMLAGASFCLLSSALYMVNDIIDAPADRRHPDKCHRPIASGLLPVRLAWGGATVLLLMALGMAARLGWQFLVLAVAYGGLTLGYSVAFKRIIILDGMVIAAGFVLRVTGGAVAIAVRPSHWLIVCAFLLALYLAFAKRRQELIMLAGAASQHRQVLGAYTVSFLDQVNTILIGATLVSYVLYTVAPETVARFGTDGLVYGTFFVVYGLLRYLALIQHQAYGGNPSEVVLNDKPLRLAIGAWVVYNALIIYRADLVALGRFW